MDPAKENTAGGLPETNRDVDAEVSGATIKAVKLAEAKRAEAEEAEHQILLSIL